MCLPFFVPVFENQTLLRVVNVFVFIIVIFQSIVSGFLIDFPQDVRNCADAIVGARFVSLVRSPLMVLIVPKKFAFHFNSDLLSYLIRWDNRSLAKPSKLVLFLCFRVRRSWYQLVQHLVWVSKWLSPPSSFFLALKSMFVWAQTFFLLRLNHTMCSTYEICRSAYKVRKLIH